MLPIVDVVLTDTSGTSSLDENYRCYWWAAVVVRQLVSLFGRDRLRLAYNTMARVVLHPESKQTGRVYTTADSSENYNCYWSGGDDALRRCRF